MREKGNDKEGNCVFANFKGKNLKVFYFDDGNMFRCKTGTLVSYDKDFIVINSFDIYNKNKKIGIKIKSIERWENANE